MSKCQNQHVYFEHLISDRVVPKPREQISPEGQLEFWCTRPRWPCVWIRQNGGKACVDLSQEIITEADGALIVPVGSLNDFRRSVRMNDELHDASLTHQ